jgi:DNA-binding beta-propeller fold protein YncE
VDPSGKFVYVANRSSGNVSGLTIDSNVALKAIAGSPFTAGSGPISVAITPLVAFASSFVKQLEISAEGFQLKESFTLARNSNGINPVTEDVTLTIGLDSGTTTATAEIEKP